MLALTGRGLLKAYQGIGIAKYNMQFYNYLAINRGMLLLKNHNVRTIALSFWVLKQQRMNQIDLPASYSYSFIYKVHTMLINSYTQSWTLDTVRYSLALNNYYAQFNVAIYM